MYLGFQGVWDLYPREDIQLYKGYKSHTPPRYMGGAFHVTYNYGTSIVVHVFVRSRIVILFSSTLFPHVVVP